MEIDSISYQVSCFDAAANVVVVATHRKTLVLLRGLEESHCQSLPSVAKRVSLSRNPDFHDVVVLLETNKLGILCLDESRYPTLEIFEPDDDQQMTEISYGSNRDELFYGTTHGSIFRLNFRVSDSLDWALIMKFDLPITQIISRGPLLLVSSENENALCHTEKKTYLKLFSDDKDSSSLFSSSICAKDKVICGNLGGDLTEKDITGQVIRHLEIESGLQTWWKSVLGEEQRVIYNQRQRVGHFLASSDDIALAFWRNQLLIIHLESNEQTLLHLNSDIIRAVVTDTSSYVLTSLGELSVISSKSSEDCDTCSVHDWSEEQSQPLPEIQKSFSNKPLSSVHMSRSVEDLRNQNHSRNDSLSTAKSLFLEDFTAMRTKLSTKARSILNKTTSTLKTIPSTNPEFARVRTLARVLEPSESENSNPFGEENESIGEKKDEVEQVNKKAFNDLCEEILSENALSELFLKDLECSFRENEEIKSDERCQQKFNEILEAALKNSQNLGAFKIYGSVNAPNVSASVFVQEGIIEIETLENDIIFSDYLRLFEGFLNVESLLNALPFGFVRSWSHLVDEKVNSILNNSKKRIEEFDEETIWNQARCGVVLDEKRDNVFNSSLISALSLILIRRSRQDLAFKLIFDYRHFMRLQDVLNFYFLAKHEKDLARLMSGEERESEIDSIDIMLFKWAITMCIEPIMSENFRNLLRSNRGLFSLLQIMFQKMSTSLFADHILEIHALGYILLDIIESNDAKLEFAKASHFLPGYLKTLCKLNDPDLMWREVPFILETGQTNALDLIDDTFKDPESCGKMIHLRSQTKSHLVSWEFIGQKILAALGPEKGREVLLSNATHIPKGAFSSRFYWHVIALGLNFNVDKRKMMKSFIPCLNRA